jgi:hypothetical protein
VIVENLGVVEGVGAAAAGEHADAEVEIENLEIGNGPALVVAAVEEQADRKNAHRRSAGASPCQLDTARLPAASCGDTTI